MSDTAPECYLCGAVIEVGPRLSPSSLPLRPLCKNCEERASREGSWPAGGKEPIWLVWTRHGPDNLSLRAVTTTEERAKKYKVMVDRERGVIDTYIEKRETNHLYGHARRTLQRHSIAHRAPLRRKSGR